MRYIILPIYMYLITFSNFHGMAIGIVISGYALVFKWGLESIPNIKLLFERMRAVKWLPRPIAIRLPEIILGDVVELIVFIGLLKIQLR